MKHINKVKVSIIFLIVGIFANSLVLITNRSIHMDNKNDQNKINDKVLNDELLTLVNFENMIPEDWDVDLVRLDNNQLVDQQIYDDLLAMLQTAKSEGLNLLVCSSYRTNNKQAQLYLNKVNEYLKQGYSKMVASDKAAVWVARPKTSEHQLGFAVDIVSVKNQRLDRSQEDTLESQWLMKNSWKYGFILRYPTNKSDITKVGYEPWHYRYVGKKHARKIFEMGVCLEEYLRDLD